MNIEIANRLVELRKKKGLSQEQLADQLGLSRQAVSKWERAEASPDTDNLICLAKLYGVSLDELLNTDQSIEDIVDEQIKKESDSQNQTNTSNNEENAKEENDKKEHVHIGKDGIHVVDKDGNEVHVSSSGIFVNDEKKDFSHCYSKDKTKSNIILSIFSSVLFLLALVAYVVLGCLLPNGQGWANYWVLFLMAPFISSIISAIIKRKASKVLIPMLVVAAYCFTGLQWGIWHPTWVMFLLIPIYYSIAGPLDHLAALKNIDKPQNKNNDDVFDNDSDDE